MSLFSSGITAASNYWSQDEANSTNLQINRETNAANKELAELQNKWNVEQWENENKYNEPAKQVERLRAAGLSASAAAQNIEGAGNSSHLESADLANQQSTSVTAPQFDFSGINLLEEMRKVQELRTETANADKAKSESLFTPTRLLTENDVKRADFATKIMDVYTKSQQLPYSTRLLKYNARNAGILGDKYRSEIDLNQSIREEHDANVDLLKQRYSFLDKYNELEFDKIQKDIDEVDQRIKESQSRVSLNQSNKALTDAQTEGQEIENEGKKTQNLILDHQEQVKMYEECFARHGFPKDQASQCAALIADGIVPAHNFQEALNAARWYVESQGKTFGGSKYGRVFLENVLESGLGQDSDRSWNHAMQFFNMLQSGSQSMKNIKDILPSVDDLPVPLK